MAPAGSDTLTVVNPTTEEPLATVPAGTPADVDRGRRRRPGRLPGLGRDAGGRAGRAARPRSPTGSPPGCRSWPELIAREVGSPLKFATSTQAGLPVAVLRSYASLLGDFAFEEEIGNSLVLREPIGVVGAITPWNYPLHQVVAKVAAALAAGCTVVLKPTEVAPLSAYVLATVAAEVGLPAGVLNVVPGTGPVVGEAIAAHPDVDMVSFTGSVRAGRRVQEVAAGTVKKVALELGGKSANVILDDAELAKAVKVGVANCYLNGGQTCTAWTRMLVPESLHSARGRAGHRLGREIHGRRPAGRRDPARADGQRGAAGPGPRLHREGRSPKARRWPPAGPAAPLDRGFFVRPTVFAAVRPESTIAQEEIFGPVLSVIPYRSEAEAVEIANGTPYGLSGAVFAGDRHRAVAFARQLRTGQVMVNGGAFNPLAPFGGYKQSGTGRELGRYGLEEFLEVKSLQL